MYRKKIKENDTHASLIYVVAMEMQMSHKHDNGTNEAPGLKGIYK